ncbi:MAG TPA: hypothetical protein PKV73_10455 [Agriterribacter sp.]|nr:hypothetical protein [Chitinophagaceae bacterium]HRP32306.1 hypothetical protein [Agriterribacter sp.]
MQKWNISTRIASKNNIFLRNVEFVGQISWDGSAVIPGIGVFGANKKFRILQFAGCRTFSGFRLLDKQ